MPQLPEIRNFNLKVIFLVHYVFISLSCMGIWVSSAYVFYNSILILLLIWSIYQDQSPEPIQLAVLVNGFSIILDVLLLIMCFPDNVWARERFSAAMAILHLIIRPFSTIILIKHLEERSGPTALSSILSTQRHNAAYEDIDRPNVPQTSNSVGGYDISTAQQI